MKRVVDPLYGKVKMTDFDWSIMTSPEVQRLRYVRMCNINSLLVTGASEPSRFEHSLGVLRLVQEWLSNNPSSVKDSEDLRAAALLHDFQTGPFGHSLQYVLEDRGGENEFLHEDLADGRSKLFHQQLGANLGFAGKMFRLHVDLGEQRWREISAIVKGESRMGPLISGGIDLDNIDNVLRLAYHAGLADKSIASTALSFVSQLGIRDGLLETEAIWLSFVEMWCEVRRNLYEHLLLDWADFSAKAMLTRSVEQALERGLLGDDSWILTDFELLEHLSGITGESQHIARLVERLMVGDLYEPLVIFSSSSVGAYQQISSTEIKESIESKLGKIGGSVIFHPIVDISKTQRKVSLAVRSSGQVVQVGTDSHRLLVGIFLARDVTQSSRRELKRQGRKLLESLGLTELSEIGDAPQLIADEPQQKELFH